MKYNPDEVFSQVMKELGMSVPKTKKIPLTEIVKGGCNGWGELFHRGCINGPQALSAMVPQDEDWVCLGCGGYISKSTGDKLQKEAEIEWKEKFGNI